MSELEYVIRFHDGVLFRVPSLLNKEVVKESFAERTGFFGRSGVHFSQSGGTMVIKDDNPLAASSDGHQLIVALDREEPLVITLTGPERLGREVMEEWPQVIRITDDRIIFRYDGEEESFELLINELINDGKRIFPSGDKNL